MSYLITMKKIAIIIGVCLISSALYAAKIIISVLLPSQSFKTLRISKLKKDVDLE